MIPVRNVGRFARKAFAQPAYALSVFHKRLRAFVSYKRGAGKSAYPEAVTLYLTHRCNLRCKMCGQWGDVGVTKSAESGGIKEEISIANYEELIDDIAGFKPNITLFGGEPLLYKHCIDLIKLIKAKGLHCCMISNATLLPRYAKELVGCGLDELNISLDGPEAKHDEIRGVPGMFRQIRAGIESIDKERMRCSGKKPFINLEFTITRYNYNNMRDMFDVARSFKAHSLNFHHLIFVNQKMLDEHHEVFYPLFKCSSDDWKGFLLEGVDKINTDILNENIKVALSERVPFLVNVYPNLTPEETKMYYRDPAYIPEGYAKRCISPWMVAYIFPNGDVRPCLNYSYSPGNIRNERFKTIWNNVSYVYFRSALLKRGIFPACARCTELFRY